METERHQPKFLSCIRAGASTTTQEPAPHDDVDTMMMLPSSLAVIKPTTRDGRFYVNITPQYGPTIDEPRLDYLKGQLWPYDSNEHDDYHLPYYHIGRFAFANPRFDLDFYRLLPRFHHTDRLIHPRNPGYPSRG